MKIKDLLEAVRRDLYAQADNVVIFSDDDIGDIYLQLSQHLNDNRESGESRGDHVLPNELISTARVALKKLIAKYSFDAIYSDGHKSSAKLLKADFKMKKPMKIVDGRGKRIKVNQYSTLIMRLFSVTKAGETKMFLNINTIYKPRRDSKSGAKSPFFVEIL